MACVFYQPEKTLYLQQNPSRTQINLDFALLAAKTITSLESEPLYSWLIGTLFSAYVTLSSSFSSVPRGRGGEGWKVGRGRGGEGGLICFAFLPSQSRTGQEAPGFLLIQIRWSLTVRSDAINVTLSSSLKLDAAGAWPRKSPSSTFTSQMRRRAKCPVPVAHYLLIWFGWTIKGHPEVR